jgi:zinc transporter
VLLDAEARVQAHVISGGVVMVLADLHHALRGDPERVGSLAIYVDEHLMISGRRHALRSPDRLRRKLLDGADAVSPADLLEELLTFVTETFVDLVGTLSDEVDDAEDKILAGNFHDQAASLGRTRPLLARLRRHVHANRATLSLVIPRLPDWFDDQARRHLHEVVERMDALEQDIELVQERTRLMQEEIASRLNQATNRNLFFLSVMTATLLPVTLITGIFGMNVGGLPWLQDSGGFRWVTAIMLVAVTTTLLLLRRRRIF